MFNSIISFFSSKNSRFLSKKQAFKLVPYQISKNYLRLELLNEDKIEFSNGLNIEFIFTSNSIKKLENLKQEIENQLQYSIDQIIQNGRKYEIIGKTSKISIDIDSINHWTIKMCKIGYDNDCKFGGWRYNKD